jgi:hypothetical protein
METCIGVLAGECTPDPGFIIYIYIFFFPRVVLCLCLEAHEVVTLLRGNNLGIGH